MSVPATPARLRHLAFAMFATLLFSAWGEASAGPLDLDLDLSDAEPAVERAVTASVAAVRSNPENANAWAELGQLLHVHGFRVEAVNSYRQAMTLAPDDYRWPYLASDASDDSETALSFAARAYSLRPDDHALAIAYADTLTREGRTDDARNVYLATRPAAGNRGYASLGLARLALASGDLGNAQMLLEEARTALPKNGEVHQLLAQTLQRAGATEAATRASWRARAYSGRTRPVSDVLDGMRAFGESTAALHDLGARLLAKGAFSAANEALETLKSRESPPTALTARRLAEVALAEGASRRALEQLASAGRIWPQDAALLTDLAVIQRQLGDEEAARGNAMEALRIRPDHARALRLLGSLDVSKGDYARATPLLERALATDPALYLAFADLALACEHSGDRTRALEAREHLALLSPEDLDNRIRLARLLVAHGERDRAITTLRAVLRDARRHPEATFDLASLLVLEGSSTNEATEGLRLARVLYARNRRSTRHAYLMSLAQAANEQPKPALQTAKRALNLAAGDEALLASIRQHLEALEARHQRQ